MTTAHSTHARERHAGSEARLRRRIWPGLKPIVVTHPDGGRREHRRRAARPRRCPGQHRSHKSCHRRLGQRGQRNIAHGTGAQVEHFKEPFLQPSSRGAACLSKRIPLMHPHGLPRSSRVNPMPLTPSTERGRPSGRRKRHERAPGASSRNSGTPPSALTMSKGQRRRV